MTVKCITNEEKNDIVFLYSVRHYLQQDIATRVGTSARTVNRVLNERGLLTTVPRIKAEAYNVMQVLKHYDLDAQELKVLLTNIESTKHSPAAFVEAYLLNASEEELGRLFWLATKAKIADEIKSEVYAQEQNLSIWPYTKDIDVPMPF